MVVTPLLKVNVPTCPEVVAAIVAPLNEYEIVEPVQLSEKVASVIATAEVQSPASVFAVWLVPAVIVGLILSVTVTVFEPVIVFPAESVTV